MFGLGGATRIYVATGATDMRLGFNGLYGLVSNKLRGDPLSSSTNCCLGTRRSTPNDPLAAYVST